MNTVAPLLGAAYLTDCVFGDTRVRHWVLSLPPPLRHLLAYEPSLVSEVLGAFLDAVFQYLRRKAKRVLGLTSVTLAHPGAVTAIQRCSGHLALNPHFHSLVTDGVFLEEPDGSVVFRELPTPSDEEVTRVASETCRRTLNILRKRGLWQDDSEPGPQVPSPETNRLCWSELLARLFSVNIFLGGRCGSSNVRRIAWITTPHALSRILDCIGLARDGPVPHPPRPAEELFSTARAA